MEMPIHSLTLLSFPPPLPSFPSYFLIITVDLNTNRPTVLGIPKPMIINMLHTIQMMEHSVHNRLMILEQRMAVLEDFHHTDPYRTTAHCH